MDEQQRQQTIKEMRHHVEEAIIRVVNGKIDKLDQKLDNYIKDDTAWKVRAEPAVKVFENTTWLGSLIIKFLKVLGLLGAGMVAYITIKNFFR